MFKYLATAAVLSLVAGGLGAQSQFIPSDTSTTGPCNITPFGEYRSSKAWVNQKYQCIATGAQLGNKSSGLITDLGFAPCGTTGATVHFDTIEVVLAQTRSTTLSSKFGQNLKSNVKTVLRATNYDWHVIGGEWSRLGLDSTYAYDATAHGSNLVVQITVTGCHTSGGITTGFHRGSTQRVSSVDWSVSAGPGNTGTADMAALKFEVGFEIGVLSTHGVGCAGSSGLAPKLQLIGTPAPGGSVLAFMSQCRADASSLQVFGLRRLEPRVDLAIIGAPSCFLYCSTDVLHAAKADVTGQYFVIVPVPNDKAFVGRSFITQGFPLDSSANNWGRAASNYGRILIGR